MSDNGPEEIEGYHGTAGYWRGHYFTALEGSMRVPALIRWPGKIPAGVKTNEIIHMVDILPTLSSVAGYQVPDDRIIDGIDQMNFYLVNRINLIVKDFQFLMVMCFLLISGKLESTFVQLDSMFGAPLKLNMPHLHNLIQDPKELYPVDKVDVSASWVFPVIAKKVVSFKRL